jgi:hypothetical protein
MNYFLRLFSDFVWRGEGEGGGREKTLGNFEISVSNTIFHDTFMCCPKVFTKNRIQVAKVITQ